jgi:integrase
VSRPLAPGEHGEISSWLVRSDAENKWRKVSGSRRRGDRYRARAYYTGWDGAKRDVSRVAERRGDAEAAVVTALSERLREGGAADMTGSTPFVVAGRMWLDMISRADSGKAPRTVEQYCRAFAAYVDVEGSPLRGLTLTQVNKPQRLRSFQQGVADKHGTGSAKLARTVLSGVLNLAVENGVLDANGMTQIRPVRAEQPRVSKRDHARALTESEQAGLLGLVDDLAMERPMDPRTIRKRRDVADLVAFMLGTGVRVSEARLLRWEHVDLETGRVEIHGTKTASSRRVVNMSKHWLLKRITLRSERVGTNGYVFASPGFVGTRETEWSLRAVEREFRKVLDLAGLEWAISHTARRTVATRLDEMGVPTRRIADQLGHADIRTTMDTYLARDFEGDKADLGDML